MRICASAAVTLGITGLMCLIGAEASAQAYPSKPLRLIVPTSPGAGADVIGRIVATGLGEVFGQQVVVDNRAGAAGNIGAAVAAKAPTDGYTLFQVTFQHAVNVTLYRNLAYDLMRDLAPVTQLGSAPAILVVHPSLPVKSVAELVRLAKAKPGALSYGSAGYGSPTFVAAELFKSMANVSLLHVPYRGGGESLTAILTGETQVYFAPLTALAHIKQGRLRPLAMTSTKRLPLAPQYPTIAELGYPGYEFGFWHGIMVPTRTSQEIITAVRTATVTVLNRPDVGERFRDLGYTIAGDQPEEFSRFLRSEIEKWKRTAEAKGFPKQ